jgi:hypothetical protein
VLTPPIPRESRPPDELGGSFPVMSPKDPKALSSYGPRNEEARAKVDATGEGPLGIEEIAELFGVSVNTVYSQWRNKAGDIKDPARRFPEPTWPAGPLWSEGVLREWADYTGRQMKPRRKPARRRPATP